MQLQLFAAESAGKQLILTSWLAGLLAHSLTHCLPTGRVGREVRDVARERVGGERAWLGLGGGLGLGLGLG